MLILFTKKLFLQSERGDPEDRKDFNVDQAHERTGRLVITHGVIDVSDSSRVRSAHESDTFNVGDDTLRENGKIRR